MKGSVCHVNDILLLWDITVPATISYHHPVQQQGVEVYYHLCNEDIPSAVLVECGLVDTTIPAMCGIYWR